MMIRHLAGRGASWEEGQCKVQQGAHPKLLTLLTFVTKTVEAT